MILVLFAQNVQLKSFHIEIATVENIEQLEIAFSKALSSEGPWVIIAKIEEGEYLPVAPVEPEKTTYRFRESMLKNDKA